MLRRSSGRRPSLRPISTTCWLSSSVQRRNEGTDQISPSPVSTAPRWLRAGRSTAPSRRRGRRWKSSSWTMVHPDDSPEIARRFGDRIQLIVTENCGGNHARNRALQAARGEWVQFLDADDYLEPEKISRQMEETNDGAGEPTFFPARFGSRTSGKAHANPARLTGATTSTVNGCRGSSRKRAARFGASPLSRPSAGGRKGSRAARNTSFTCGHCKPACGSAWHRRRTPSIASGRNKPSAGATRGWSFGCARN